MAGSPGKCILAIDLGTSGPKVALVDTRGCVLGCETHPTELVLADGGGAEQRPEDWWAAIVAAAQALHARKLAPRDDIIAVAVTGQWAGTVPVDRDGEPLCNAIIWMDSRGAARVRELVGGAIKVEGYGPRKLFNWIRRTGGAPSLAGKDPVGHILYLRHQRPDVYGETHKFLEPKDFINLRLTGRFRASVDSIALHWVTDNRNIERIDYDRGLLAMTTLPRDKLPDLVRAVDVVGPLRDDAAEALGVPAGIDVMGGTPDVQSAAIGSGAVGDYEGHLYIGTSSWLTCHVPFKKTDLIHSIASLPSAIPGRYFVANSQETAGACLNWLRDAVVGTDAPDFYAAVERTAATAAPGSGRLIFTPWLFGERSPVDDDALRAGLFNASLHTTRAEIVRAVLEGVAYNTRWLLQYVEKFIGRRMEPIRFVGGGANSDLWCQIHADVLDREIAQVADPVQSNARGAALLASLGLGHITLDEINQCVGVAARYRPNPDTRGLYDDLFREYLNLYRATKGIYARLNRT